MTLSYRNLSSFTDMMLLYSSYKWLQQQDETIAETNIFIVTLPDCTRFRQITGTGHVRDKSSNYDRA